MLRGVKVNSEVSKKVTLSKNHADDVESYHGGFASTEFRTGGPHSPGTDSEEIDKLV